MISDSEPEFEDPPQTQPTVLNHQHLPRTQTGLRQPSLFDFGQKGVVKGVPKEVVNAQFAKMSEKWREKQSKIKQQEESTARRRIERKRELGAAWLQKFSKCHAGNGKMKEGKDAIAALQPDHRTIRDCQACKTVTTTW